MDTLDEFLARPVGEFLDDVASDMPAPGAGTSAGVVVAIAAGLAAMAARISPEWESAEAVLAEAEALRERVTPLAPGDGQAYAEVLAALRLPTDLEPDVRNKAIGNALARAAEIPLVIAGEGARAAELALEAAEHGNPNLRGDAVAGALLASGAVRAAANLVEINLGAKRDDPRIAEARRLVVRAEAAARAALSLGP
jgi:formiminotetrahydrofolate cyclodeaminase